MTKWHVGKVNAYTVFWENEDGDEQEATVFVKMTGRPYPAQGPTYACGGQPAEGPEFDVVEDTIPPHVPPELRETLFEQAIQQAFDNASDWYVEIDT